MDTIAFFKELLIDVIKNNFSDNLNLKNLNVEISQNLEHGDLSTNLAMILASQLKNSPFNIANKLMPYIQKLHNVCKVEVAGPGFINISLNNSYWHENLSIILKSGASYGDNNIGQGEKVNIEFVSANPTGPLHIGHIRNGVYGDVIANMMKKCNYNVTKEFYINDIGSQIDKMVQSVYLRYQEALGIKIDSIPEGMYPGKYLIDVANKIIKLDGSKWLNSKDWYAYFKDLSIHYMMEEIKEDLKKMGIVHDVFISESSLHQNNQLLSKAIKKLQEHNLIYTGILQKPLSKRAINWQAKPQTLVRTTKLGSDNDCALYKATGEWSYFASDLAYIMDKSNREFDLAIYVIGSEQLDYVKRLEKLCYYLTDDKMKIRGFLYQMVGLIKDNKPLKLSKRSGTLITVKECLEELNKDIIRFMILTHKSDMPIRLNIDKLKLQNKDNPVFYTQYAYARAKSLFKIAKIHFPNINLSEELLPSANLALLTLPEEINLIKYISQWPTVIKSATQHLDPQRLTLFIHGLSSSFHSLWTKGKSNKQYRFIIENNVDTTLAKLALVKGITNIIESCTQVMSIDLKDSM